jgi:hypothetical protein
MPNVGDVVAAPPGFTKDGVAVGSVVAAPPGFNPDGTPAKPAPDLLDAVTKVGGSALHGALHAGQGVLEALGAPQRGVAGFREYVDQHGLAGGKILSRPSDLGAAFQQGGAFFMDPKKQAEAGRVDRAALAPDQGGFIPTDAQINRHLSGFPATAARWAAQTGAEVLGDPTNAIPVGAIPEAAKMLGLGRAAAAASKIPGVARVAEVRSQLFNPEHHLGGLTEHGQNVVAMTTNRAKQAAAEAKRVEDKAIAVGRNAIKAGQVPPTIAAAFAKYGAAVPVGVKPSQMRAALDEARTAHANEAATQALRDLGLLDAKGSGAASTVVRPTIRRSSSPATSATAPIRLPVTTAPAKSAEGATAAELRRIRGQDVYASLVPNPSERLLALDAERAAAEAAAEKSAQTASAKSKVGLNLGAPRPRVTAEKAAKPFTLGAAKIPAAKSAEGATAAELLRARGQDALFKDPANVAAAREGVAKHIRPQFAAQSDVAKGVADVNRRLKSMFLAVPFPHMANLTNLAYNKYGLPTTLRGLGYAAQEATGLRGAKLKSLLSDLQSVGGDYQYEHLFGETHPLEPVRQLQRAANAVQDKTLNATERGLRASMLESELARGKPAVDAVRGVHKALGTDAPTEFTRFLNSLPLSQFPRFHTQTALGSFGRTLVNAPGRITGFEHAFGSPENTPTGQARYHPSTPTAAGLRAADNPLGYFASGSTLGGLLDVTSPYSPIGLALRAQQQDKKGQHAAARKTEREAIAAGAGTLFPASGLVGAALEAARKKKGKAGESAPQDTFSSLFGGYWSK